MPPMWNSGSGVHITSSGPSMKRVWATRIPWRTRASWDSIAPFGDAVVPEVYMMRPMSPTDARDWRRSTSASSPDPAARSTASDPRNPVLASSSINTT